MIVNIEQLIAFEWMFNQRQIEKKKLIVCNLVKILMRNLHTGSIVSGTYYYNYLFK